MKYAVRGTFGNKYDGIYARTSYYVLRTSGEAF